jgi:hypothetical protein
VFTGGALVRLLGVGFWALDAAADGLRSALLVLASSVATGPAGAAAPLLGAAPIRKPLSVSDDEDDPLVRMNANTATIAAAVTIAAPIALCERGCRDVDSARSGARRGGASLRRAVVFCCLRAARAVGLR